MQFWLDTIKWETGEDGKFYRHPSMAFDLRSIPDRGTPGLTAGKFVLCAGPAVVPGPDVVPIGETGSVVTPASRGAIGAIVGEAVPAITVEQMVERLCVNLTDPTGFARCKPVRVGRGMRLRFKIRDVQVNRVVQITDSEWLNTLAMERLHYAGWRADVQAGRMPAGQHLRAFDYLRAKYVGGRAQDEVDVFLSGVRGGLPDEGTLPHRTTIQCNFNDADGVLESHANDDGGSGHLQGTWAWTATVSDWNIATNQAASAGAAPIATPQTSLSLPPP